MNEFDRRSIIAAGAGLLVAGTGAKSSESSGKEVGAVEDLMREHGVLRRALLAYRNMAAKLRANPANFDPELLGRTATLFRTFGEDYHEKKLEEEHIFPLLRQAGGPAAAYVDTLVAQHRRGREITDYFLGTARKGAIGSGEVETLAYFLDGLDLMYAHHAAREDTVVFPAWKNILSARQLEDLSELFEEIERRQFGKDGFEEAVSRMARVEDALGIANISQFTPPLPPNA